jgi:hypothetical protein
VKTKFEYRDKLFVEICAILFDLLVNVSPNFGGNIFLVLSKQKPSHLRTWAENPPAFASIIVFAQPQRVTISYPPIVQPLSPVTDCSLNLFGGKNSYTSSQVWYV